MSDKPRYACVFASWRGHVLLVQKNHPEWQQGRLNGVGGQVEEGETPLAAAQREFTEETSLVAPTDLREFCVLEDSQVIVHFYAGSLPDDLTLMTGMPDFNDKDEALGLYPIQTASFWNSEEHIDNLCWLVPMAFGDEYHIHAEVTAYRRVRKDENSPWQPVL